jgi:protein TonB
MRLALPGSALVHGALFSLLLLGWSWPETEDAAAPAPVSVSIVPMSTIAANAGESLQSDATISAVSAGRNAPVIEPIEPLTPDTTSEILAPVPPEELPPDATEPLAEPPSPESLAPVATEATAPEIAPSVEPETAVPENVSPAETTAEPVLTATEIAAQPIETIEAVAEDAPPFPRPRIVRRAEIEAPAKAPAKAPATAARPPSRQPPRTPPRQAAPGNGGNSSADSVAAAGAARPAANAGQGGRAEVARYPSQVINKLRNALRRAGGRSGEVLVRFTVLANGSVSGISIARSSGNAALDDAGVTLVRRAAPFPPIPAAAGRSSWTFDVPLAFRG